MVPLLCSRVQTVAQPTGGHLSRGSFPPALLWSRGWRMGLCSPLSLRDEGPVSGLLNLGTHWVPCSYTDRQTQKKPSPEVPEAWPARTLAPRAAAPGAVSNLGSDGAARARACTRVHVRTHICTHVHRGGAPGCCSHVQAGPLPLPPPNPRTMAAASTVLWGLRSPLACLGTDTRASC